MSKTTAKKVIFLVRAYNDLDTQMPLINELCKHKNIETHIISYPCDGDVYDPQSHEFSTFFRVENGSLFTSALERDETPLVFRLLQKAIKLLANARQKTSNKKILFKIFKIFHVFLLIFRRKLLKINYDFYRKIVSTLTPDLIIADEALFMKGRSPFIDNAILPYKEKYNTPLISIHTGQLIYFDPFPNKSMPIAKRLELINYRNTPTEAFLVPSKVDESATKIIFPDEKPLILGNLRMDKSWINYIHKTILPYSGTTKSLQKQQSLMQSKNTGPNVVFMLSKIGYGIEVDELINAILSVIKLENVTVAIKPHTRGMKLDFLSKKHANKIIDVTNVPSSELIEWADIVLFTGSGIAFHQMVLGKTVGFLKFCQNIEGIFDQCPVVEIFNSKDQLTSYLEGWTEKSAQQKQDEIFKSREKWITKNVYAGYKSPLSKHVEVVMNLLNQGSK